MAKKQTKAAKAAKSAERAARRPDHEKLVAAIRERYDDPRAASLMREGGYGEVTHVCPTGINVLDRHVIGVGGLPYGQITEFYGPESSGKSTLLSVCMAAGQRDGMLVAFHDAETKFNPTWGKVHGLDVDKLVQYDAEYVEEWQERTDFLLAKAPRGKLMIALDSIASMATKSEYFGSDPDASKEDQKGGGQGEHARVWTKWGRQFKRKVWERQAVVVWANQPRSKIGVMYGPDETTFGGRWLKHAPLVRLNVNHGESIKEKGVHVGRHVNVSSAKNQLAPPFRKARLRLDYATGFDDDWATLSHAKDVGAISEKAPYTPASVREARANLGWPERSPGVPELPPVEGAAS